MVDHALRKEGRRALVALAVSAVVVTSWNGWIKAVESSPEYKQPAYAYQTEAWLYFNVSYARNLLTYVDPFFPERGPLTPSGFVRRVKSNLKILPQSIGQAVSGWWTPRELAIPLGALVLGGLLLLARREHALVVYVALSFAAICATPFQTQFPRYLLPLYPFLALALFEFLAWVTARVRLRWPALPPALAAAVPWAVLAVVAPRAAIEALELYAKHHQQVSYVQNGRPVSHRLFYYGPGARGFRRCARLAGRACGSRRRARHGRPAMGLSQDRPANRAAAVRARRARRPAADRQRARQVSGRVDRPGRLQALHHAAARRQPAGVAAGLERSERRGRDPRARRHATTLTLDRSLAARSAGDLLAFGSFDAWRPHPTHPRGLGGGSGWIVLGFNVHTRRLERLPSLTKVGDPPSHYECEALPRRKRPSTHNVRLRRLGRASFSHCVAACAESADETRLYHAVTSQWSKRSTEYASLTRDTTHLVTDLITDHITMTR